MEEVTQQEQQVEQDEQRHEIIQWSKSYKQQ